MKLVKCQWEPTGKGLGGRLQYYTIMGRKSKPAAIKKLEGNPGKKPIQVELEPTGEMPEPPPFLDEYALEEWNRLANGLNRLKLLDVIDMTSFSAYCMAYSRWRHAEEELAKLVESGGTIAGLVQKTQSGNWIQQPLIGISNSAVANMVKYASEFGLTPAARAKLGVIPDKKKKSKFDGLIGINGGKK